MITREGEEEVRGGDEGDCPAVSGELREVN